jgi:replicative DNA helicase
MSVTPLHRQRKERTLPHDIQAEESLLGAMLITADAVVAGLDGVAAECFYKPSHRNIFSAIARISARGEPIDTTTVANELDREELLDASGGPAALVTLVANVPSTSNAARYARIVVESAALRGVIEAANAAADAAYAWPTEAGAVADDVETAITAATNKLRATQAIAVDLTDTIDEFCAADEEAYDWLVPGVLERMDRIILTGPEGGGKSTFMRQMSVQLAAGIHPFTGAPIQAVRVLYIDLENSRLHVRRQLNPLRISGGEFDAAYLRVAVRPEGLDLLTEGDRLWLHAAMAEAAPEVMLLGPLYKLAAGDPTEEQVARTVALTLDKFRAEFSCALILEAHSPHANGGKRPERPYGASLWLRWPEFGLHLAKEGHLRHWRGARDEREWPTLLKRGGDWPWSPETNRRQQTFALILETLADVGTRLSERDLAMKLGVSQTEVHRAIANNRDPFNRFIAELDEPDF